MHAPDKGNYANECEFIKIEPPSLIAFKLFSKPIFRVVAAFEEVEKDKMKLVLYFSFYLCQ